MNLYEINEEILMAYNSAIDQETGEIIDEEALNALGELSMERDEKIENILLWIKNLTAEAEALKKEKQAFADRQSSVESKASSLKRYIGSILNGEKFFSPRVSVNWRKSQSVEYSGDVNKLPENCIRKKEPEVNKTELKKMLIAGVKIPGARLVENNNMQIK